jgi:glycosyltransferase involved in cell wall biosynthesis
LNKGSICGVDLQKIDKVLSKDNSERQELLKKTYNINDNDFIFTYLARKTKDKGAMDILEAFEKVCEDNQGKNLKLFFIGPYEEKIDTTSFIKKFSERVIDIGKVDNHLEFISISDILCLPSYREGFGSIVIDAAALGVPSIGYDIPGLQDSIINNKTGLLSKKGDTLAFAEYMNLMYSDTQLRERLGLNAHTYAVNYFSSKVISQCYDKLYKELISS